MHNVIHRDVAGRNVLVDVEGGRCCLADFGHALTLADGMPVPQAERLALRTLAPETLLGPGAFSFASDVWAFGCFLYELCVGLEPWKGVDPRTVARLTLGGRRPPLPPPPLLDAQLAALIAACWASEPSRRPAIRDVRVSLQSWLDERVRDPASNTALGKSRAVAGAAFASEAAATEVLAESLRSGRRGQGAGELGGTEDDSESSSRDAKSKPLRGGAGTGSGASEYYVYRRW